MEEATKDKYQEPAEGEPEEKAPGPKEREISDLERKLAEKKSELVQEKQLETKPAGQPGISGPAPAGIQQQADQLKDLDKENQIKQLCQMAFEKGLDEAVGVAKKLDDPYLLDEFHDTLVDELYKRLVEQGKLKQL